MKVLLTGASGFIGQHVYRQLLEDGIETFVLGRTKPDNCATEMFVQADLISECSFGETLSSIGATHLIHLAWYTEHGKYWTSQVNLQWKDASVKLVEDFCATKPEKVIMAGTCAEYDWSHALCIEDSTPILPSSVYGMAKDETRRLSAIVCENRGVDFAWARIFLPFGSGEDRKRLVPSLIEVFRGKREPFGINTAASRDFLHVADVATGIVALLGEEAVGVYNICSGEAIILEGLVRKIATFCKAEADLVLDLSTARPYEPDSIVGSNEKLKRLGWAASTPKFDIVDWNSD